MPYNFPNSPTVGQRVTIGSATYQWNGSFWDLTGEGVAGVSGSTGYTGSNGFVGSRGYTGSSGGLGSGYTGSSGDLGYTGSRGYTGSVGPTPDLSSYATQTWVTGQIQTSGKNSQGSKTLSASAPTGTGTPGDMWYVY